MSYTKCDLNTAQPSVVSSNIRSTLIIDGLKQSACNGNTLNQDQAVKKI